MKIQTRLPIQKVLSTLVAILLLTGSAYAGRVILSVKKGDSSNDATLPYTVERAMAQRLTGLGGVQVDLKSFDTGFEVTFDFKSPGEGSGFSFFQKHYDTILAIETYSGALWINNVFQKINYAFWVHEFKDGTMKDFSVYDTESRIGSTFDDLLDKVAAKAAADLL